MMTKRTTLARTSRRLARIALLLAGVASTSFAQATGELSGRVRGPDGNPIASASVLIVGHAREANTDRAGRYRLSDVPAGPQRVVFRYMGLRSDTLSATITPGRSVSLDATLQSVPLMLAGVKVEGERGGQLSAINQQRRSPTVVNVVSADEIGSLPDQNVAEAVQRVPGVSIQTSRGEGRFVSIRGTAPTLNTVTLNGQTLASTAESRATALDLLPSSMVASIEVTKAVTPDMDGSAIGGSINIATLTAFDHDRPFLFGTARGLFHQQQVTFGDDKRPYELDLTAGRRFGRDQSWGIVVAGSASRRDFTASVLDPDGWEEVDNSIFPEELELQVEDNERQRYGLTSSLDWRPSPTASLFLRGLFTRTREVASNSEYEFGFEGDLENQTLTTGRYTAGSAELDLSEDDEKESLWALTLGGSRRLGQSLIFDFAATGTRGVLDRVGPDATFETSEDNEDQLSSTFDVAPYFFTITPENPGFIANPANYPLRSASWGIESNRENTWVGAANLRWDTRLGAFPAFVKVGGKLQLRDKVIDDQSFSYVPLGIDLAPYALPATGTVQGGSEAFVHGDVRRFSQFFADNRTNPQRFQLDPEATALNGVESDSDNRERVSAGYVMGSADLGRATLLAGIRVEQTRTESRRFEFDENADTEEITVGDRRFDRSYTNVLPAIVFRYAASENLLLRAAWTNTIGRPDYEELAGFRRVEFEPTAVANVFEGTITEGNPGLKPFEAANLDASIEYYIPAGGLLSVGGFHKRIANPIYEFDVTERDVEFEGRSYAELRRVQDRNADAGTLRGIELAYSQPLFFLPRPFDGLGITANAAFIDSKVTVPGREEDKLPFFGQSNRVFNLVPYYQRGPIELRLAWTLRGKYLNEIGGEAFEDRYIDSRETVDVTARYTFANSRLELLAQGRNLGNEPEVGYQGIRSRYDVHTLTGRSFTVGLSARY
jgi:TonB-dependent receptor